MAPPSLASLRTSASVTPVSRLPTIVSPASPAPDHQTHNNNGDHYLEPNQSPLFLSIDSGSKKMRALVIDQSGSIEWIAEVEFDGLGFGTRNGVFVSGDEVTCPSLVKVAALDKLLSLLAAFGEYRDSELYPPPAKTWILRIVTVSGAAVPNCHFLAPSFAHHLDTLNQQTTPPKLMESITSDSFSVPIPPTSHDTSATSHARQLELALAHLPGSPVRPTTGASRDRTSELIGKGAMELAMRTGRRAEVGRLAVLLLRLRLEAEEAKRERRRSGQPVHGQHNSHEDPLAQTNHIVAETNLIASLLLGRIAPLDVTSAAATGLFNINTLDWDAQILSTVIGREGVGRVRDLLGPVQLDGGASLGTVGAHLVNQFGFSPECIVVLFATDTAASALACPLDPDWAQTTEPSGVVCLSVNDNDSITLPLAEFMPGLDWTTTPRPATNWAQSAAHKPTRANYLVTIENLGAATGRSLVRDLNADGNWNTYSQLCAIVPHGGSVGLDDKCYSIFSTHGPSRGLSKFSRGARVAEFEDRKLNPRLIIEGQYLSMRLRLSRLSAALSPPTPTLNSLSANSFGFDPFTTADLPRKVLAAGGGSANPALIVLLSTILGCEVVGMPELVPAADKGEAGGTTSSALGAAKKARWAWARVTGSNDDLTFEEYEREREVEARREGMAQVVAEWTRSSMAGLSNSLAGLRLATGSVVNGELNGGTRLVSLAKVEGKEFEYYGSMLHEFDRLSVGVSKGVI